MIFPLKNPASRFCDEVSRGILIDGLEDGGSFDVGWKKDVSNIGVSAIGIGTCGGGEGFIVEKFGCSMVSLSLLLKSGGISSLETGGI